ncbi:hypothetical protein GOBAR_DD07383 [Gossypium barbadense]|nr:hypothetical protein GOBAR_DD07383 [Gossypium barbadense]
MNNQNVQNSGSSSSPRAPSSIPIATSQNAVSVNVNTDPRPSGWYFNDLPVVFFHCKGCTKPLARDLHYLDAPLLYYFQLDRDRLVHGIREGNYLLYPNQTLYWNGNQLRYAHTNQPIKLCTVTRLCHTKSIVSVNRKFPMQHCSKGG